MSALSPILRLAVGNRLHFWCPGCREVHGIQFGEGDGPRWAWNGDAVRPTFQPSILVRGSKMTAKGQSDWEEWLRAGKPLMPDEEGLGTLGHSPGFEMAPYICHSFVTEGQIQFLGDCTHALAGQTVPIPEWPTTYGDGE